MKIFISHSSSDAKAARDICTLTEENGYSCFLAPRDIRSGHEYAEEIINGIDSSDIMLLLLSEAANTSPHVLREIERAVSKKIPIIVYKLEDVKLTKSMEYFLMTHQWVSSEVGADYSEIIRCIKEFGAERTDNSAIPVSSALIAETKSTKSRKTTYIIIAAIAAAIVAAAAIIGVALSSGNGAEAPDSSMTSDVNAHITESTTSTTAAPQTTATTAATTSATQTSTEATTTTAQTTSATTTAAPQTTENTTVSQTTTVSTEDSAVTEPEIQVELGDRITLGSYNNEPIVWRVLEISADGKSAKVVADKIITMKAFDAAEGGKYNYYDGEYYYGADEQDVSAEMQRILRGDNRWEYSNIRTWLNSDRENVEYIDQPPVAAAMCELKNGYNTEVGFLKSFTKEERDAILTTEVKTGDTVTEDKVFLLSREEYNQLPDADISKYGVPTAGADAQDGTRWYELNVNEYSATDHYWWLRDAVEDSASELYLINFSYAGNEIITAHAGLEGYGIRPAMTVDLTSPVVKAE